MKRGSIFIKDHYMKLNGFQRRGLEASVKNFSLSLTGKRISRLLKSAILIY
jgi:hypothetical protein